MSWHRANNTCTCMLQQMCNARKSIAPSASLLARMPIPCSYAGLAPAVLRHVPYTGIRVLTFEQLRGLAQQRLGAAPDAPLPLPVSLAIGLTAGGAGQLIAVPADLVKVRMQVRAVLGAGQAALCRVGEPGSVRPSQAEGGPHLGWAPAL